MAEQFSRTRINKFDRGRVHDVYRQWPTLADKGFSARFDFGGRRFRRALVLGMGGSAAGGDIVAGWLRATGAGELWVCKGYIPFLDLSDSIAIACSVSGSTAETIAMAKTASKRGAELVSVSSGGSLRQLSETLGWQHVGVPEVVAPRYMLPYIVFSCLSAANSALRLGCEGEAAAAIRTMREVSPRLDIDSPVAQNPSKKLANSLLGKTPAIYGTTVTRGAAVRFKNVLNENAKKHALVDVMPELFHNEIETWERQDGNFLPLFLRHSLEEPTDASRADAMTKILAGLGRGPLTVRGMGTTGLAELMSMVYELDFASYYTAVGLGRDPLPTELIDRLKSAD